MPVETYIADSDGNETCKSIIKPGMPAVVARDYINGEQYDILVECDAYDKGGDVYRFNHRVTEANRGGITDSMRHHGYLGSVATNGVLRPIIIHDHEDQVKILCIEHQTDKFVHNSRINRLQQV